VALAALAAPAPTKHAIFPDIIGVEDRDGESNRRKLDGSGESEDGSEDTRLRGHSLYESVLGVGYNVAVGGYQLYQLRG
jgi:hypothetical protein